MTALAPETRRSGLMGNTDPDWAPAMKTGPKHTPAGIWQGGKIVAFGESQETDNKGEGKLFPSGDQIMQVWVNVQTDLGDDDDDGIRRIFLDGIDRKKDKAGEETYCSRKRAGRLAVIEAKAPDIEIDGELYLRWVEQRETGAPSLATHWEAIYRRPSQATGQAPASTTAPATAPAAKGKTAAKSSAAPF